MTRRNHPFWKRLLLTTVLMAAVTIPSFAGKGNGKGKDKPGNDPPPPPPPPAPFNYVLDVLPDPGDNVALLSFNNYGDVVGDVAPSVAGTFIYLADTGTYLWENDLRSLVDPTADWFHLRAWVINDDLLVGLTGFIGGDSAEHAHAFQLQLPLFPGQEPLVWEIPNTAPGMDPIKDITDINQWGDMCGTTRRSDGTTGTAWSYDALLDETTHVGGSIPNNLHAWAINNAGQLAGWLSDAATGTYHAYRYTPGEGFDIFTVDPSNAPFSDNTSAYGISDFGEVVGSTQVKILDHYRRGGKEPVYRYEQHAFVSTPEGTDWTDLGTFGFATRATGINSSGVIVGYSSEMNIGFRHAFVHLDGTMYKLQDLVVDSPAGITGLSKDIDHDWPIQVNEAGQIAGIVVYDDGRPDDIFIATPVAP